MKTCLIVFMLSFGLFANDEFYFKKYNYIEAEQLKVAVNHFHDNAEKALVLRARVLQFIQEMNRDKDKVLTGADLEKIQKHIQEQLQLRETFYSFINTYKNRPFLKKEEGVLYSKENQVKGGMLALAAASVLYDNYALCFSVVQKNGKLRRLINKGNSGYEIEEDAFEEIVKSFHSPEKRSLLRKAMDWYLEHVEIVEDLSKKDKQLKYIKGLLESSPSIRDINEGFQFGDYIKFITLIPSSSKDSLVNVGESSMNNVSMIFGNSMGLVQTRKGRLFKSKKVEEIKAKLKPMDILLEKNTFSFNRQVHSGSFWPCCYLGRDRERIERTGLVEP